MRKQEILFLTSKQNLMLQENRAVRERPHGFSPVFRENQMGSPYGISEQYENTLSMKPCLAISASI